ncbi:MAG: 4-(cytidine 5'-diphospho)-2-C-methyl-D-erythritol kinase [Blastochloris sp.]|nr:4-(cytidine 5'-diphospho)-2-C-methyl-D-erythritol kinase [Blastochloris sp.]
MMKLFCPAKINLTLHILGKRPDGFHDLETLMCPVSLFDELELEESPGGIELTVTGADLPGDATNLAYKAAAKVLEKCASTKGVRMRLTKKIPMGGGLAGGSSNAASVIRGVNDLLSCELSEEDLHGIAASLGSDINFFLQNGPAICRGRGEMVSSVGLKDPLRAVLINPGFGVPTPWAFQSYASDPQSGEVSSLSLALTKGGAVVLRNDLEPAVFKKYFWLQEAKHWLSEQAEVRGSLMSGSGATVFGVLRNDLNTLQTNLLKDKIRTYFGSSVWTEIVEVLSGTEKCYG